MNVGLALQAAIERGREHQRRHGDTSGRGLHVRFMTQWGGTPQRRLGVTTMEYESPGLLIRAAFVVLTPGELAAQGSYCEMMVPWEELDAKAGDLVGIVDAVVAAAERAVGLTDALQ
jgi:hypothetical protein